MSYISLCVGGDVPWIRLPADGSEPELVRVTVPGDSRTEYQYMVVSFGPRHNKGSPTTGVTLSDDTSIATFDFRIAMQQEPEKLPQHIHIEGIRGDVFVTQVKLPETWSTAKAPDYLDYSKEAWRTEAPHLAALVTIVQRRVHIDQLLGNKVERVAQHLAFPVDGSHPALIRPNYWTPYRCLSNATWLEGYPEQLIMKDEYYNMIFHVFFCLTENEWGHGAAPEGLPKHKTLKGVSRPVIICPYRDDPVSPVMIPNMGNCFQDLERQDCIAKHPSIERLVDVITSGDYHIFDLQLLSDWQRGAQTAFTTPLALRFCKKRDGAEPKLASDRQVVEYGRNKGPSIVGPCPLGIKKPGDVDLDIFE